MAHAAPVAPGHFARVQAASGGAFTCMGGTGVDPLFGWYPAVVRKPACKRVVRVVIGMDRGHVGSDLLPPLKGSRQLGR
jgi:hypothetical protein